MPDWWSAAETIALLTGPLISAEDLWSAVTSPSGKSCGGSRRLPFHNYWGHRAPEKVTVSYKCIPLIWAVPFKNAVFLASLWECVLRVSWTRFLPCELFMYIYLLFYSVSKQSSFLCGIQSAPPAEMATLVKERFQVQIWSTFAKMKKKNV